MEKLDSLFRGLFSVAPTFMILTDGDGYVIEMNPAMLRGLGYDHDEVVGKHYPSTFIPAGYRESVAGQFELSKTGNDRVVNVNPVIARDGTHRMIEWHGSSVTGTRGQVEAICAVGVDITERIAMENDLRAALEEREILLRELYHRTKNNLQQIESIIEIVRRGSGSAAVERTLQELGGRIASMALVHEQVSRSGNLARISLADYLHTLIPGIVRSRVSDQQTVTWSVELPTDVELEAEQMNAIGLITNEAITNSLKYAFIGRESGRIHVAGALLDGGQYRLSISDDGIGLSRDPADCIQRGFGMTAITGLARHELGGKAVLESEGGLRWIITFPLRSLSNRNARK